MTFEEWGVLRNIVFEAQPPLSCSPPESAPDHEAVRLVREFLRTQDRTVLDEAARIVAKAKPGLADKGLAEKQYWLLLDKS